MNANYLLRLIRALSIGQYLSHGFFSFVSLHLP